MEALDIEGTGIGLTISKELVGLMEGDLGFDVSAEEGALFWFVLPVSTGAESARIVGQQEYLMHGSVMLGPAERFSISRIIRPISCW